MGNGCCLDVRIEIEECLYAQSQLRFDLLAATFQHVHRYVRLVAVLQRHRSLAYRQNFIGRQ